MELPARRKKRRRTSRSALVITVVLCALAGAGVSVAAGVDGSLFHFSPRVGSVGLIDGSRSDVIGTLEERLPLVSNVRVVKETIPAAPDPGRPGRAVTGLDVLCDLRVNSTHGSDITEAMWERDLFIGALADEFAARGFGTVVDANATLVTPDGTREPIGGGLSYSVASNQVFKTVPTDIAATIADNGATVGLHSIKVATMQVLQDVLVIHAVSNSPSTDIAALQRKGGLQFLLGQSPMNFEGVYLEIDDNSGGPVYITDTAPRDGGGGGWTAPSLQSIPSLRDGIPFLVRPVTH